MLRVCVPFQLSLPQRSQLSLPLLALHPPLTWPPEACVSRSRGTRPEGRALPMRLHRLPPHVKGLRCAPMNGCRMKILVETGGNCAVFSGKVKRDKTVCYQCSKINRNRVNFCIECGQSLLSETAETRRASPPDAWKNNISISPEIESVSSINGSGNEALAVCRLHSVDYDNSRGTDESSTYRARIRLIFEDGSWRYNSGDFQKE